jgi:hypothetical protein
MTAMLVPRSSDPIPPPLLDWLEAVLDGPMLLVDVPVA